MGLRRQFGQLLRSGQGPRREFGNLFRSGHVLKFEAAVDALVDFIPQFLRRDPDWNLFASDFKLVDHGGRELKLGEFVPLWALLHSLRGDLTLTSDVGSGVTVVDGREFPGIGTKIYASLKVTIDGVAPRFHHRLRKVREDILGTVEAEVVFSLNDRNEVSELRIEDFLFDHEMVESWPDIDLAGAPASAVAMREWAPPRVSKIVQWIHGRRRANEATGAADVPGIEEGFGASGGMGGVGGAGSTPPPLAMA